ncbi:hypothetical protein AGDE_06909 [Angomonas deanei]|uniref:Transmembrane protein n=1 Tax=Angomonas deanei TaxID=59799 RepID=A0A7G2C5N3_9TRYP|nr:hypothetical protein AGDE_06909 [Angomonas deanei]CAD2214057.1 hypothetical protein, conserved [Angomonas deanei]|eukprot:EPY36455.1 hypothetical protein AGDE_06909 [Angomonas deanei]
MLRKSCACFKPKRTSVHAHSSSKLGKQRFDLMEALQRDRERVDRNKTLPWKERLAQLKVYPWKFFIAFMIFWSWLGTYAVPYFKGMKPGELPSLGGGTSAPEDAREKLVAMPKLSWRG